MTFVKSPVSRRLAVGWPDYVANCTISSTRTFSVARWGSEPQHTSQWTVEGKDEDAPVKDPESRLTGGRARPCAMKGLCMLRKIQCKNAGLRRSGERTYGAHTDPLLSVRAI